MKRFRRIVIYAAGMVISAVVLRHISYPDSIMACLAVAVAVVIIDGWLRMCDRLLGISTSCSMNTSAATTIQSGLTAVWVTVRHMSINPSGNRSFRLMR